MSDFNYERINFKEDGTYYGANEFNRMDKAIYNLYHGASSSSGSKFIKKQTENLGNAMKKLRMGSDDVEVCFFGDSVFYAMSYKTAPEDIWVYEDCVPDINTNTEVGSTFNCAYSVKYNTNPVRNKVTIYDAFRDMANRVFNNKIQIKKKIFCGHTAKWAYEDYYASESDFCIINFGINDAMGAHVIGRFDKDNNETYRGDVTQYITYMRLLIEREIEGGTAVILLGPVKQLLQQSESGDTTEKTMIDVYEQVCEQLAMEYGVPFINGNDMTKNFGMDLCTDFTHFSAEGNRSIGCRLVAPFVGQSPLKPLVVNSNSYLGVHPQLDNVNISGSAEFAYTDISPNPSVAMSSGNLVYPLVGVDKGIQVSAEAGGKVVWSFYCEEEGMVVVPSLYTESEGVGATMKLDFGVTQPQWSNYWYFNANRGDKEPSTIEINNSDLKAKGSGKNYDASVISSTDPVLRITSKGWHTIEITPLFEETAITTYDDETAMSVIVDPVGSGSLAVFGLRFLSYVDYKKMIG